MLFRLATVLPVMFTPPASLRMPVTCCAPLEADDVAALRLLAVVVLPTVLPVTMVLVPVL